MSTFLKENFLVFSFLINIRKMILKPNINKNLLSCHVPLRLHISNKLMEIANLETVSKWLSKQIP